MFYYNLRAWLAITILSLQRENAAFYGAKDKCYIHFDSGRNGSRVLELGTLFLGSYLLFKHGSWEMR